MAHSPIAAMAFYHPDGLIPSWKQALRFAGEGGRVATLPDIIGSRTVDPAEAPSWRSYFTTASAEYYGLSRRGNPVLAVIHGAGPLSTPEGCLEGYAKDGSGRRRSGRIRKELFWKLLDGRFGDVFTVDWSR